MFICPYSCNAYIPDDADDDYYRASYRIVVNRGARTLTLIKNRKRYKVYPIAIGKLGAKTPPGTYRIINRAVNPGGPYGARWLGLSIPSKGEGYGIHGTSNPASIGKAVSRGCIRMHNKDVIELANIVPIGTPVKII